MVLIWGYTSTNTLEKNKEIGRGVQEVKQLFSALLFQTGIKGVCVNIAAFHENTTARISLYIDSEKVFETDFSPEEAREYIFELENKVHPVLKIEVALQVIEGLVEVPLSSIGIGMGFQRTNEDFLPTNHLALGLILP